MQEYFPRSDQNLPDVFWANKLIIESSELSQDERNRKLASERDRLFSAAGERTRYLYELEKAEYEAKNPIRTMFKRAVIWITKFTLALIRRSFPWALIVLAVYCIWYDLPYVKEQAVDFVISVKELVEDFVIVCCDLAIPYIILFPVCKTVDWYQNRFSLDPHRHLRLSPQPKQSLSFFWQGIIWIAGAVTVTVLEILIN